MGAGKWFFSCMRSHVPLQKPWPAEGFATHMTFVLEVMGENMHGQRRHGHVDLVAGGTFACHLAVEATVSLLVSAQIGGGGVGLSTLIAGVSGSSVADPAHFLLLRGSFIYVCDLSLPS